MPGPAGHGAMAIPLADEGRADRPARRARAARAGGARRGSGERVAPAVETLVAVALQRDALQAEAVETAALRRSDELKTALLRMVSHDLRSPLTAIVTAGHAVQSDTIGAEDRRQLGSAIVEEGERLSRMVAEPARPLAAGVRRRRAAAGRARRSTRSSRWPSSAYATTSSCGSRATCR